MFLDSIGIFDCHLPSVLKGHAILYVANTMCLCLNSFLDSDNICQLLITFANSLDTDQDRQDVGPDLDPSCFKLIVFLKELLGKNYYVKGL